MNITRSLFGFSMSIGIALVGSSLAVSQESAVATEQKQDPKSNWSTNCNSLSRKAPASCSMEQRVILRETGQQLARLSIQIGPQEPRQSALLIQLPLGLSIRDGVAMHIDGVEVAKLDVQTCEAAGCYAGSPVSAELLAGLKAGKDLKITVQDLQQKPISISFVLTGFTASYSEIE